MALVRSKSSESSSSSSSSQSHKKVELKKEALPAKALENLDDFQFFVQISGLTKTVTANNIKEIFCIFGEIKEIIYPY